MCGIVAAVATRNIVPVLGEGLKKLDYRDYDSAGLALLCPALTRLRSVDCVAELAAQAEGQAAEFGIAYTRWALFMGVGPARLMRLGRTCPDLDAALLFERDEWQAASIVNRKKVPKTPPRLDEVRLSLIAIKAPTMLGGILARKGDGEPGQHHQAAGTLDPRAHGGAVGRALDQVALPVSGHQAVLDFVGTGMQVGHVRGRCPKSAAPMPARNRPLRPRANAGPLPGRGRG